MNAPNQPNAYDILIEKSPTAVSLGIPHYHEVVTVNSQGEIIQRQIKQARLWREDLGNGVSLDMVLVPGGTFMMGSPKDEPDYNEREGPQHQVSVEPFLMGRYPITQAQWRAVMGNNLSQFNGDNHPVEQVSWKQAMEFCDRLSEKLGQPYTLPSEAQWEYACRAGTTTAFHFGTTITTDLANYCGKTSFLGLGSRALASGSSGIFRGETTEVGYFPPNSFGLYDMHGNVWEWCLDHSHDSYEGAPSDGSAWVTGARNQLIILRGGSWGHGPNDCRCAYRSDVNPDYRDGYIGFRVLSMPSETLR